MRKTKFTVIDALIILVVILAAIVVVMKFRPSDDGETGKVEFSVLASCVDEGSGKIIEVGDEVLISYAETTYATVTAVEEDEYIESEFNKKLGKFVSNPVVGKSDLKITVECSADISDTAIKNGKTPIRVGNSMPVRGKGYAFNGYVVEIEER